jgi:hypothetical protein
MDQCQRTKVKQFMSLTGTTDAAAAQALLEANAWDVEHALECFISVVVEEQEGASPNK